MRENIIALINSGVTAYRVSKDTGIPLNTATRIFNGEASIENISLKNAEILSNYYLRTEEIPMNNISKNEITEEVLTKTQFIRMFAQDQMELDYHLDDQAQEMGISVLTLAKRIAEEEFNIRLNEGTIVKVGRRYKLI